jgi:Ran GTPase-activating protein (RanGAP) involved in mRNA processing and transport
VSGIIRLSSLQCLGLSGTSLSDLGLTELSKYTKSPATLKELVLNRCNNISDEGLQNILDTFQSLEILSFANCNKVTMKSVNKLNEYFEKRKDTNNHNYCPMKQISFNIW